MRPPAPTPVVFEKLRQEAVIGIYPCRSGIPEAMIILGMLSFMSNAGPEMKYRRISRGWIAFFFTLFSFLSGGCSGVKMPVISMTSLEGMPGHFFVGEIVRLETGETITFHQLIQELEAKELIFIGEVHDNPEHHLLQVQILQALIDRHGPVTLAVEFFQEPQQNIIDHYLQDNATEDEFLQDVNWARTWSFHYHYYRPLILLSKDKKCKVIALNAPRDIVKKVARSGLAGLEPEERSQLADKIDLSNKEHRAYLREIYNEHSFNDLKKFEYFYEAQCVWEDTMAENISDYVEKDKNKMVVLTGNGHIINKFGIPNRAAGRVQVRAATILLYAVKGSATIKKEMADFVWLTGACSKQYSMTLHKYQER